MNPQPTCLTCEHWHPHHPWDGWCTRFNSFAHNTEICFEHMPVVIEPIDKLKNPSQPIDKEEWFG
jgi:hypothetical protein